MKVGIAQIDTTVGDLDGNAAAIRSAYRRSAEAGADLVLFPELAITGYPPMDLLERQSFVDRNLATLDDIAAGIDGPTAVIGFVARSLDGPGKPLHNAAAVVERGRIVAVHRKALLPTYDVFDEARYFEPSPMPTVVPVGGLPVAVTICEDIWNAFDGADAYHDDPVAAAASMGAGLLVNVSASPFEIGKPARRRALAREIATRHRLPVVYANLVGGNDGLVFDGGSFAVGRDGLLRAMGPSFSEAVFVVEPLAPAPAPPVAPAPGDDAADIVEALCLGLRDFCAKGRFGRVLVGLSGGIDSAVVAALAARALGPQAVIGITMPSAFSSEATRRGAADLAAALGIEFHEIPIDGLFRAFVDALSGPMGGAPGGVTEENLQARVRGTLLMAWSNRTGALVLNTGNKSELAVGYATLYGDMVGGLAVIGDLTKDRVYAVARELNRERTVIPEDTMTRAPSAELRPDQRDEDSLPPYPVLDPIVRAFVEDGLDGRRIAALGYERRVVDWVLRQISASEYKRRQAPTALKVTPRAFGPGRRFPIIARYREDLA
jgi:NAD+ synthetase